MDELKKNLPETLDVMEAAFAAAFVLKKHFLDGVQAEDFMKIVMEYFNDEEFQGKLKKAIEGAYLIPVEIKNAVMGLKFHLILEIVQYLFFNIKRLVSSSIKIENK